MKIKVLDEHGKVICIIEEDSYEEAIITGARLSFVLGALRENNNELSINGIKVKKIKVV